MLASMCMWKPQFRETKAKNNWPQDNISQYALARNNNFNSFEISCGSHLDEYAPENMSAFKSEYFSKYNRRDYFENSKICENLKMCKAEICETDVQISLRQEILNYNLGTNWSNLKLNFSFRIFPSAW